MDTQEQIKRLSSSYSNLKDSHASLKSRFKALQQENLTLIRQVEELRNIRFGADKKQLEYISKLESVLQMKGLLKVKERITNNMYVRTETLEKCRKQLTEWKDRFWELHNKYTKLLSDKGVKVKESLPEQTD